MPRADAKDLEVVYRRQEPTVLRLIRDRVDDDDDAADLLAETFVRALAAFDQFDPERGTLVRWVSAIAANLTTDYLRRESVKQQALDRVALQLEAPQCDALTAAEEVQRVSYDIVGALARIPELQGQAVHRRVVLEQPYEVIALDMGCSVLIARQRVNRGLRTLRRDAPDLEAQVGD